MKSYPWKTGVLLALAALLALFLALVPGCGGGDGDDNPEGPGDIPDQWVGLWLETITATDCDTQQEITFTDTLTICPDAEDYDTGGDENECEFTWDGDEMVANCTYPDTFEACVGTMTIHWHAQVSGTSFTGQGTSLGIYTGGECDTLCTEIVMSGQRIGDAPEPCNPYDNDGDGDGDLAGLSVDVTGGDTEIAYDVSDQVAIVLYDTTSQEYVLTTTFASGGYAYGLDIYFPREGGPFEFAAEAIEGKALAVFTRQAGLDIWALESVSSGLLTISHADDDKIAGTFEFTGGVAPFPTGDPVAYQFQNGTFELSVDAKTGGIGKAPAVLSSQERVFSKMRRDLFRAVRQTQS